LIDFRHGQHGGQLDLPSHWANLRTARR
jgi:hypothetical protein